MRIYEHEAKRVLADGGIVVPGQQGVVTDPCELPEGRFPLMVKAQVLVGGRGKAGGIKRVTTQDELVDVTGSILARRVGGYEVGSLLLEDALEYTAACYLGITTNPANANNVIIASAEGGVDIEEVARSKPGAILKLELEDNPAILSEPAARQVGAFLAERLADPLLVPDLTDVVRKLYSVYEQHDCKVVEINPLLITADGPVAADAKMVLDDNALYRQARLLRTLSITSKRHDVAEPTTNERRAAAGGFFYVDLLDEGAEREADKIYVGLVPGGAGYGIFSIDEVSNVGDRFFDGRLVPVNFMDSGGGPTQDGVAEMFSLLMDYPLVDVIVTSRFGGISSCDTFMRGLVQCLSERRAAGKRVLPVYGRMVGTDLPSARAYLEQAQRETPEDLEPLSMVVGNRKIMAEIIREGVADFVSGTRGGQS